MKTGQTDTTDPSGMNILRFKIPVAIEGESEFRLLTTGSSWAARGLTTEDE
jgi:hypothetical protein